MHAPIATNITSCVIVFRCRNVRDNLDIRCRCVPICSNPFNGFQSTNFCSGYIVIPTSFCPQYRTLSVIFVFMSLRLIVLYYVMFRIHIIFDRLRLISICFNCNILFEGTISRVQQDGHSEQTWQLGRCAQQCENYNLKSYRRCNNIVSYEFICMRRTCDYI